MAWLLAMGGAQGATYAYIANAGSQEISVLELNRDQGRMSQVQTVAVAGTVMPLAVSPDRRFLYAALRSEPYRVASFAIDAANGHLRKLGEAPLAGSMAYIDLDATGHWLLAASYGGNKISLNHIDADGTVGAIQQVLPTMPNAHAIHADANNRFVLATSLGGDNLSIWRFDAQKGLLAPNDPPLVAVTPRSGARHFIWDRAADIHMSPDGRFLYTSERSSSTITAFQVHQDSGLLAPRGHTATEMTPRSFAIDSTGRFLVVAGQDSQSVSVHAIDVATGALGAPSRLAVGKSPSWVQLVDPP